MNQLSGGQKTAVAISLIFAISKVEPPPFYILDEVDSALDPNFRNKDQAFNVAEHAHWERK